MENRNTETLAEEDSGNEHSPEFYLRARRARSLEPGLSAQVGPLRTLRRRGSAFGIEADTGAGQRSVGPHRATDGIEDHVAIGQHFGEIQRAVIDGFVSQAENVNLPPRMVSTAAWWPVLVGGEGFAIDASVMEADASRLGRGRNRRRPPGTSGAPGGTAPGKRS